MMKDKTEVQQDAISKIYAGKILKISGKLEEVSKNYDDISILINDANFINIRCNFTTENLEKFAYLTKGTQLSIEGQIINVSRYGVRLKNCRLI